MADQNITALPVSTTPESSDQLLLVGATEEKLIDYDKLADAILQKLTSKQYTLDQGTKTLPAALNELNSKALRSIDNAVSDWNAITKTGIYSGTGTAKNAPIDSGSVWIDAIVLASNGNTNFLNLFAFSTTGVLFCRRMDNNVWSRWIQIK